jgi:DNA-binding CsgD family transcriptional regulator
MFDSDDKAFLKAIGPDLATGARTALLVGEARDPQWPDSPGLVVLSEHGEVESTTPGVERWLSDLPDGDLDAGRLPSAVHAVAGRALRTAEGRDDPGEVALARVLSRSGTWVVLHGTSLVASGLRRAAVIVEPAHPARITPLLMSAYGLTEREQEVTRLVLQGDSTTEIAERLVVSPHTVQEHLKKIFEKTSVRSRRELVGKVFFAHYEPRFRDNEARVLVDEPDEAGLRSLGVPEIVVTLGSRGSLVFADGRLEHVAAMPATSGVDPTGAGDAFAAAYLASRAAGNGARASARRATALVTGILGRRLR